MCTDENDDSDNITNDITTNINSDDRDDYDDDNEQQTDEDEGEVDSDVCFQRTRFCFRFCSLSIIVYALLQVAKKIVVMLRDVIQSEVDSLRKDLSLQRKSIAQLACKIEKLNKSIWDVMVAFLIKALLGYLCVNIFIG